MRPQSLEELGRSIIGDREAESPELPQRRESKLAMLEKAARWVIAYLDCHILIQGLVLSIIGE